MNTLTHTNNVCMIFYDNCELIKIVRSNIAVSNLNALNFAAIGDN